MIDTTGWSYVYKITDGYPNPTNMLYTPMVNPEGTVMCMLWDHTSPYQTNEKLTAELIDFFFKREVTYLTLFQGYSWCPKILDIEERKIFIEWNNKTLNTVLYQDQQDICEVCPDWKDQIFTILKDIVDDGYYKTALYPHCFFIDNTGQIKTFDFYGCIESMYPYVKLKDVEGMIGHQSVHRFAAVTEGELLNLGKFFKSTMQTHLSNSWPDNPFPEYYKRLFND